MNEAMVTNHTYSNILFNLVIHQYLQTILEYFRSDLEKVFNSFFHIYIKMSKDSAARYYQKYKEKIKKKPR